MRSTVHHWLGQRSPRQRRRESRTAGLPRIDSIIVPAPEQCHVPYSQVERRILVLPLRATSGVPCRRRGLRADTKHADSARSQNRAAGSLCPLRLRSDSEGVCMVAGNLRTEFLDTILPPRRQTDAKPAFRLFPLQIPVDSQQLNRGRRCHVKMRQYRLPLWPLQ